MKWPHLAWHNRIALRLYICYDGLARSCVRQEYVNRAKVIIVGGSIITIIMLRQEEGVPTKEGRCHGGAARCQEVGAKGDS